MHWGNEKVRRKGGEKECTSILVEKGGGGQVTPGMQGGENHTLLIQRTSFWSVKKEKGGKGDLWVTRQKRTLVGGGFFSRRPQ